MPDDFNGDMDELTNASMINFNEGLDEPTDSDLAEIQGTIEGLDQEQADNAERDDILRDMSDFS